MCFKYLSKSVTAKKRNKIKSTIKSNQTQKSFHQLESCFFMFLFCYCLFLTSFIVFPLILLNTTDIFKNILNQKKIVETL